MTKEQEFGFDEYDQIYIDRIKYLVNCAIKKCDKFVVISKIDQAIYNWIERNFIKMYRYFLEDGFRLSHFTIDNSGRYLIEWENK